MKMGLEKNSVAWGHFFSLDRLEMLTVRFAKKRPLCVHVCVWVWNCELLIKKKTIKTEKPRKMVKAETGDW